jgi:hypothetical protein
MKATEVEDVFGKEFEDLYTKFVIFNISMPEAECPG